MCLEIGSSHCRYSVRKGVLKNFANFTGKHLCWSLFYEVVSLQPARFLKRDSNKVSSCEVCKTFKNTYFYEYLQTTASGGVLQKSPFLKTLQYSQDERSQ